MASTTREAWLNAALELLHEHGPSALTIERVTERVGRTKGSFYHHFGSHARFKTAIIEHLEQLGYTTVVQSVNQGRTARERLTRLIHEVASGSPGFETTLRAWAGQDDEVAAFVAKLDTERLAYLQAVMTDLTHHADRASVLARLMYASYLGALYLQPAAQGDELTAMLTELARLATPPEEEAP